MKPQLFMFHFAGGNSYSYRFLEPYLREFTIEPVELPGRGMRSDERLLNDFESAANDLFNQVALKIQNTDFILFGHSMGALLAFRVAGMLDSHNKSPKYLIVSGNPGPAIGANEKRYLLENKDFVSGLKKLGGLSVDFLQSEELLEYFLPIIKADFQIVDENGLKPGSVINVPIYAIMGDLERYSNYITNWSSYTASDFTHKLLKGNHFFIYDNAEDIGKIIKSCYHIKTL